MDTRNAPMSVDKSPVDELVLKLDLRFKLVSICHNSLKIEEFCISPLTYNHDIITKDVRVLFCLKNQVDGRATAKFRVRFDCQEMMVNFVSVISNYVKIQPYDEWRKFNRSSSSFSCASDNSFTSSTVKLPLQCTMNFEMHDEPKMPVREQTHIYALDENSQYSTDMGAALNESAFSVHNASGILHNTSCSSSADPIIKVDMAVQTEDFVGNIPFSSNAAVNIHIENLISADAVKKFAEIFRSLDQPGVIKCNCTQPCFNRKCTCFRSGVLCNSKCHGNKSCINKHNQQQTQPTVKVNKHNKQ